MTALQEALVVFMFAVLVGGLSIAAAHGGRGLPWWYGAVFGFGLWLAIMAMLWGLGIGQGSEDTDV